MSIPSEEGELEQLDDISYRAAWYYYHDDLTQAEIARELRISRPSVSRLLERARRDGLVQITLAPKLHRAFGMSVALRDRFGLDDALVLPSPSGQSDEDLTARLAIGGGQYLATRARPGDSLAVGWGNTVSRALLAVPPPVLERFRILTLTGGVDDYLRALYTRDTTLTLRQMASVVPAPMIASSPSLARALLDEAVVRDALASATAADHAIVGIGAVPDNPTIIELGYMSRADMEEMGHRGAVGDMLGRFYDEHGRVVAADFTDRLIGTELDRLRDMRDVIAVAGGVLKRAAIAGALAGGYLNVLVTDHQTAEWLIEGDVTPVQNP